MKLFLVLTTLLIASTSTASELTLGMSNTICVGEGRLVNRGAPDIKFSAKRRFHTGFAHIQNTINVFGAKIGSNTGLIIKQNGASLAVYDPAQPEGEFFKKAGIGACGPTSCTYKTTARGGEILIRETITPTAKGFDLKGQQKFLGVTGNYQVSFTCKPLVARKIFPW